MSNLIRFKNDINPDNYKELVSILDNYILAMQLCGHTGIYCDVMVDRGFLMKRIHNFNLWSKASSEKNSRLRFKFSVYAEQSRATKAKFKISIPIGKVNARKLAPKLKRAGFTTWENRKSDSNYYYDLYCYDSPLQLKQALEVFADYII